MRQVMLAAAPATLFGIWLYGWPALNLVVITLTTVIVAEVFCLHLAGRATGLSGNTPGMQQPGLGVRDGSALVTGLILAMSLPPWAPWWLAVTGGLIAIIVAKGVFGGTGQNLFNPAMVARVALLIAFPAEMTRWVEPSPLTAPNSPSFMEGLAITFLGRANWDAVTSATTLDATRTALAAGHPFEAAVPESFDHQLAFLGFTSGSLAESSALFLLLGGLYLIAKRTIAWDIPVVMLATLAILGAGFHLLNPDRYPDVGVHLLAGSTILAAFFIATDPTTSPATPLGRAIFAAGCALIIWLIRTYGGYPEATAFAILLMNCCTPIIDHYLRPRIYGRNRLGKPLNGKQEIEKP